jgi:hypothetical protein
VLACHMARSETETLPRVRPGGSTPRSIAVQNSLAVPGRHAPALVNRLDALGVCRHRFTTHVHSRPAVGVRATSLTPVFCDDITQNPSYLQRATWHAGEDRVDGTSLRATSAKQASILRGAGSWINGKNCRMPACSDATRNPILVARHGGRILGSGHGGVTESCILPL